MTTQVIMPQMGESIFEGTLTKWLKKAGDTVVRDEPLFEIATDKVDSEIPAPASGILSEILVPEGKTIQINTVLATIEEEGGSKAAAPEAGAPEAGASEGVVTKTDTAEIRGEEKPASAAAPEEPAFPKPMVQPSARKKDAASPMPVEIEKPAKEIRPQETPAVRIQDIRTSPLVRRYVDSLEGLK